MLYPHTRCSVLARPPVSGVSWYLEGRPLSPDLASPNTPLALSLPADPQLAGANIACNATNSVGSSGQAVKIRVSGQNYLKT